MASKYYRDCHLNKKPTEAFEFFLRYDEDRKGNLLVSITPDGPADRAGLKNGDRIIELNGKTVEKSSHSEVVSIIKESGHDIMFKVIDEENDPNKPSPDSNGDVNAKRTSDLRPRLCHILKKNNTLGFSIEAQGSDKPGHFINEVAEGGPAAEAGVRKGDRIIEVGGTNVEKMNHAKVVALIKKNGNKVKLLVADKATYQHFLKKKSKIKAKHASVSSEGAVEAASKKAQKPSKSSKKSAPRSTSSVPQSNDSKARLVHVVKATGKGYGFFLRVKKSERGEYIGDVQPGKPGDRCGLMENDRVIAVNGQGILLKDHDDVVELIKANANHVVLLVVGPKAIENAKNNGLMAALLNTKEHIIEKPRDVKLKKEDGYGFYLKSDGKTGHVFADIEDGGSASKAGVKDGDMLGYVNEKNVMEMEHEATVKLIKDSGNSVELIVGSAATFDLLRDLEVKISKDFLEKWPKDDFLRMPDLSDSEDFFKLVAAAAVVSAAAENKRKSSEDKVLSADESGRITVKCTLRKVNNAFGFFLRDEAGHFLGNIEEDGAAGLAGVKENDQIIEVNGVNVEKESHDKVVEMIKDSGEEVVFLVVRKESPKKEEKTVAEKVATAAAVAVAVNAVVKNEEDEQTPPLPRFCELERLPNGYGFNLNAEEGSRPGQYMKKIVSGGAASIAGVREGDRLVEVNDIKVAEKTHDEIVAIIKNSGTKFTVLVVDEKADLYYKNKNIEITKALITGEETIPFFEQRNPDDDTLVYKDVLEEMAILSTPANDNSSNASSVIETEATVHVDPDQSSDKPATALDAPPPPSYEDASEEVADLIEDAISDMRSDAREELEEIAQELREEGTTDGIVEEIKDEIQEELQEEIREEIREEIVEEIKDEIKEDLKEEMKEELMEDLREEAKEEIIEDIRDEIIDNVRENAATALKAAAAIAVVDEIRDAIEEERESVKEEEERKEKIVEEVRETAEEMRERIERETREKIEKETRERIERETRERLEREMQEKFEEELRAKKEEEMRQKLAAEAAAPSRVPDPPKAIPVAVIASSFGREIRPKASVKKTAQSFVPKVDPSVNADELSRVARNLRSVKKFNEIRNGVEEKEKESPPKKAISSKMAMFESGNNQETSASKPSWQRTSNASVKPTGGYVAPKAAAKVEEKPGTGRQTSWSGGGMSFKIVETSSTFN